MNGILLIDKPVGWTSFDVVAKVRGTVKQAMSLERRVVNQAKPLTTHDSQLMTRKVKVGHTGTLDPLATGLLVIVVGTYCKRAGEFSKLDKTYEVTMKLGQTSTTGDEEGVKTAKSQVVPSLKQVHVALKGFVGDIMQTPPIYSAIKVNGQRAYKLARAGQEVKLEPRPVNVNGIQLTAYSYPEVKFTAHVGSGTYIRSLVEDIGQTLETGAYMTNLRRTTVGAWNVKDAISMDGLTAEQIVANLQTL